MKKLFISLGLLLLSISVSAQIYTKDLAKAAKKGDAQAITDLGICYLNGSGVAVDNEKAFECFVKVWGNPAASFHLAQMVEKGLVPLSQIKQIKQLKTGIDELEKTFAEIAPQTMSYLYSDTSLQSLRIAYTLYFYSALVKNTGALIKMGDMCKKNKDYGVAATFYSQAKENGSEEADQRIKQLEEETEELRKTMDSNELLK